MDTNLHITHYYLMVNKWYYVIIDFNFAFIYKNEDCLSLSHLILKEDVYEYFYSVNEIRKIKINSLFD